MEISKTGIEGLLIIEPKTFFDERGWFCESYSKKHLSARGINIDFVQDNHSFSLKRGTFRGLHFQKNPYAQAKLVRCTRGAIMDIAVDLRQNSPTYKKWVKVELSEQNRRQLLIPKGFAHGFLTLEDNTEVQYKTDNFYCPSMDMSIRYDDPEIGLKLPCQPILSPKDKSAPYLNDIWTDYTVLVTGSSGMLGHDVARELKRQNYKVLAPKRSVMDITDAAAVRKYFNKNNFDCVIHCAAYTAVDKAEFEREQCFKVNHQGTANLVKAAKDKDVLFVYISTDFVYGNDGKPPRKPDDRPDPLSVYGLSKLKGEEEVIKNLKKYYILRTAWLFGAHGKNFVSTIINNAKQNKELRIVNDCAGSPTFTEDLAKLIASMLPRKAYGVYNASNEGSCSRYELAKEALRLLGIVADIIPISSKDYFAAAKRPQNSSLDNSKLTQNGFELLPPWQDALRRYIYKGEFKA